MVPDAKTPSANANVAKGLHIVAYLELVPPIAIHIKSNESRWFECRDLPWLHYLTAFTAHKLKCRKVKERDLARIVGYTEVMVRSSLLE